MLSTNHRKIRIPTPHPPKITRSCLFVRFPRQKAPKPRSLVNLFFLRKMHRKSIQLISWAVGVGVRKWWLNKTFLIQKLQENSPDKFALTPCKFWGASKVLAFWNSLGNHYLLSLLLFRMNFALQFFTEGILQCVSKSLQT